MASLNAGLSCFSGDLRYVVFPVNLTDAAN